MWIYKRYKRKNINVWLFSLLISDLPMFLILSKYVITYWNELWNYPKHRLLSILIVGVWTYLGPVMIVKWIDSTYELLDMICKIKHKDNIEKWIHFGWDWKYKLFIVFWIFLVIIILITPSGCNVLEDYYFSGYSDINYWLFIICVGYVAYQTSWFFLFLLKSKEIIFEIIEEKEVLELLLLNEGRSYSLTMLGEHISQTAVYFLSGLLFFPIMIEFLRDFLIVKSRINITWAIFGLMGIYILCIMVYLMLMNNYIMKKVQLVKDKVIERLIEEINKIEDGTIREFTIDSRIRYVIGLNINPIASDQYLKIIYGLIASSLFPSIFAIFLKI